VRRVLFDHCVPKPLRRHLPGLEIRTAYEQGWDALRNGDLLSAAETAGFEVFITADRNLRYQQNLRTHRIAVVELPSNRLLILVRLVSAIRQAAITIGPGGYIEIPIP